MNATDLLLLVALVVLSALFVGCGDQALRTNAAVARAMLEVQAESGPIIREQRINAGVEAGRAAHARGEPEQIAQAEASAAAERWTCAIEGHRLYAGAVGSYIDSLALYAAGDGFDLLDALPFVRRALDAYRLLVSCLSSLGSDALPEVPSFLDMLPPTWNVSTEAP